MELLKQPPTREDPYCLKCAGYGYHKRGADMGWIYCTACLGRQRRPVADYDVKRRAQIEERWDRLWLLKQADPSMVVDTFSIDDPPARRRQPLPKPPPPRRRQPIGKAPT